jgi:PAS domain S-box-containing protein
MRTIKISSRLSPSLTTVLQTFFVSCIGIALILLLNHFDPDNLHLLLLIGSVSIATVALIFGPIAPAITTISLVIFTLISLSITGQNVPQYPRYIIIYLSIYGAAISFITWINRNYIHRVMLREKHFHGLVQHSLHPIILKDLEGTILDASNSIAPLLGRKPKELRGKKLTHFIHPDDLDKHQEFFQSLLTQPAKRHKTNLRFIHKDGSILWLQNDAVNLRAHPHIKAIVSSLQNISKRVELNQLRQKILAREKEARTAAEKAVKERDEFLAIASHELRTPLTNVLLQLQVTLRQILNQSLADFSGKELLKNLTTAEQQSQRLSLLIKELLSVSLARTGNLQLKLEPVSTHELITSIIERFKSQIEHEGRQVKLDLTDTHKGNWDSVRLEQAITNLLSNALKYGKEKPVHIASSSTPTTTTISVTNYGPAIKESDQENIFNLFQRGKNNGGKKGLGIGLFISRQIIRAHGGDITFTSHPKKGTTFTITLPNHPLTQASNPL